jgi:hypothetical protein
VVPPYFRRPFWSSLKAANIEANRTGLIGVLSRSGVSSQGVSTSTLNESTFQPRADLSGVARQRRSLITGSSLIVGLSIGPERPACQRPYPLSRLAHTAFSAR